MLTSRVLFFVSVVLPSTVSPAFAAGEAPVAEAGLGLIAYVDDTVILDGSGSYDPEGDALTYAWTQVGGPPVQLQDGETAKPRFPIVSPGTLRFELVVSDDLSASAPDVVEVVVPYERIEGVETSCAVVPGASAAAALLALAALTGRRRR